MAYNCISPGLQIDIVYKLNSCSGYHQCNIAVYNFILNGDFKGIVNLNNLEDGGERGTSFFLTSSEATELLKQTDGFLYFGIFCALPNCHVNLPQVIITDTTGVELFNDCLYNASSVIDLNVICETTPPPTTTPTTAPPTTPPPTTTSTTVSPTTTTGTTPKPPLPTTLPKPPIGPVDPIELDSVPSENSIRDVTLIDSIDPLSSDVVLTTTSTTTSTTTTTTTTTTKPPTTTSQICKFDCDKLGY